MKRMSVQVDLPLADEADTEGECILDKVPKRRIGGADTDALKRAAEIARKVKQQVDRGSDSDKQALSVCYSENESEGELENEEDDEVSESEEGKDSDVYDIYG